MSPNEHDVHQAMKKPVASGNEAVGIAARVDAAGPQPAPRFSIGLNQGGNLLKQRFHFVPCQPRQSQRLMTAAVAKLHGAVGQPGSLHCWTPLRPARGACVLQNRARGWGRSQLGRLHRRRAFLGRDTSCGCQVLKVLCVSLSSVAHYWGLGSAGVARHSPPWRLLLVGTTMWGLLVA
jgi:hypothetical protein